MKETRLDQILFNRESDYEKRLLALQDRMRLLEKVVEQQKNDKTLLINALISMFQRIRNLEQQLSLSNIVKQQHSSNSPHRR